MEDWQSLNFLGVGQMCHEIPNMNIFHIISCIKKQSANNSSNLRSWILLGDPLISPALEICLYVDKDVKSVMMP